MTTSVADALAIALQRHGVTHIFGQSIPTALFLAAEECGIRQIFYRTENAGGAMADGYARLTNNIGIVTAQNGPAATLLVAPLAEALKASIPLLALVQEVPRANRGRNAFQELDHEKLFGACAKSITRLDDSARLEDDLAFALTVATTGRPGPVVLLLPKDTLRLPARAGGTQQRPVHLASFPRDRVRPEQQAVRQAAQLLASAQRPVVIAGGGVHGSAGHEWLEKLQELASVPVATTTMGKGAVNECHELSIGVVGSFMGELSPTHSLRPLVAQADLVMLVGTRTNENGTDSWRLLPESATYLHVDIAPEEVGRNYESIRLVGDARTGLEDLVEELSRIDLSHRTARRAGIVRTIATGHAIDRKNARNVLECPASPIRPERVMHELDQILGPDAIAVADASYSSIWVAAYLTCRRAGQRFLFPRGLAGLGWGVPMALGAKVAHPDRPVVCVCGDGGFGHTWSEIETAVREELPVTIIVLNNSILGFQKHGELQEFGRHTTAVHFHPVDHSAIARACGADATRVEDPADLHRTLTEALASRRPTLVEVLTDPRAYPPITSWDTSEALADMAAIPA